MESWFDTVKNESSWTDYMKYWRTHKYNTKFHEIHVTLQHQKPTYELLSIPSDIVCPQYHVPIVTFHYKLVLWAMNTS